MSNKTRIWQGILILVLFLSGSSARAENAVQRLRDFSSEVKSLRADFKQVVTDANHQQVQTAQGTFYLSRPGRFRWDYVTPFKQILVGDGHKVWFYDTELEQVTVKDQNAALGSSPALLLSGDKPLEDSFNVVARGKEGGLDWLELSPKTKDTEFTRVRLGFGAHDLEAMELTDSFGQVTRLRFTHMRRNPVLASSLFKFVPPKGVDVIGEN